MCGVYSGVYGVVVVVGVVIAVTWPGEMNGNASRCRNYRSWPKLSLPDDPQERLIVIIPKYYCAEATGLIFLSTIRRMEYIRRRVRG